MDDKELEKLLKLAEEGGDSPQNDGKVTDVEKYIRKYQLQPGDIFVPAHIIYYDYYYSKQRDRITKNAFFRRFSKHYESVMVKGDTGYYLNSDHYDLSIEGYFKSRALLRRLRNGQKKHKKK